jgi:hypothetical protein
MRDHRVMTDPGSSTFRSVRCELLELAARRGAKGFSELVAQALETYLRAEADRTAPRKRATLLWGAVHAREAQELRTVTEALRRTWR